MSPHTLYRPQELAFRTQYAELKERAGSAGSLLYGTPGTLVKREGTGYAYWYRVYYPVPGRQAEQLVGRDGDVETLESVERQIEFAQWAAAQVRDLRKLQFQVADKGVAGVLVELHNRGHPALGRDAGGDAVLHGMAQRTRRQGGFRPDAGHRSCRAAEAGPGRAGVVYRGDGSDPPRLRACARHAQPVAVHLRQAERA